MKGSGVQASADPQPRTGARPGSHMSGAIKGALAGLDHRHPARPYFSAPMTSL